MRRTVAVALLCLFAAAAVQASEIPDKPKRYVVDKFGVLTPAERVGLEDKLVAFAATAEVYVYIGRTVPSDTTMEQFATATFNYWGIGDKTRNNGVLLMLFLKARKMRIETGDGIRPTLTDSRANEILDSMKPLLRSEDYDGAVNKGVDGILHTISGTSSAAAPLPVTSTAASAPARPAPQLSNGEVFAGCTAMIVVVGGFLGVMGLIIWVIFRVLRAAVRGAVTFGPTGSSPGSGQSYGTPTYGVRTGGRTRVDHYYHDDRPRRSWFSSSSGSSSSSSSSSSRSSSSSSSGSSSSSSGSSGGGHSSGGGASGSW
ncbi:MAG: TPM domain-containing protein [Acidobacteria bacterium]|nr:TPM domain-containing protein [Acidobacteriota bacterium]